MQSTREEQKEAILFFCGQFCGVAKMAIIHTRFSQVGLQVKYESKIF
jgi:hypothetical protein